MTDAVRLGADPVGYTLYGASPAQERGFERYRQVREHAQQTGLPLIAWSCPCARAMETTGGTGSSAAVDYAARTARPAAQLTDMHSATQLTDIGRYPAG